MATNNIVNLQDYKDAQKPHLVIECEDAVHVVPVAYIKALIAGEPVEPLSQSMLAAILKDYLHFLAEWNEANGT